MQPRWPSHPLAMAESEAPFPLLRGKLGAARVVLDGVASGAQKVAISKGQANAFLDTFHRIGPVLTSDQRATLQGVAVNAKFESSDAIAVLSALAGPRMARGSRSRAQDYRSFPLCISEERWTALLSEELHSDVKESILTEMLRSLGAFLPCELTFKRFSCLLMMVSNSREALQQKTTAEKKADVKLLKQRWHLENRRLSKPEQWVEVLPQDPAVFRDGPFGVLFTQTFASKQPVAPKIDMRALDLLDASFKARGSQELLEQPLAIAGGASAAVRIRDYASNAIDGQHDDPGHAADVRPAGQIDGVRHVNAESC